MMVISQSWPVDGGFLTFKIARSGGSWFASMLKGLAEIAFTEEGITHKTGELYTTDEKETYLQNALRVPLGSVCLNDERFDGDCVRVHRTRTGTIRDYNASRHHHPGFKLEVEHAASEYYEMRADYDKAKGPTAKGIPTCGLSMSTMGSNDLNFTKIMDHGRHKLILYIRTNVAKMGIAMKRGLLVEKFCHHHNVNSPECASKIPETIPNSATDLMHAIKKKIMENEVLVAAANDAGVPYLPVVYEGLQADKISALKGVKAFLGLEWRGDRLEGLAEEEKQGASNKTLVKTTSEDLRLVLENYDALMSHLKEELARAPDFSTADGSSLSRRALALGCLISMVEAAGPKEFSRCLPTPDGGGLRAIHLSNQLFGQKEQTLFRASILRSAELSRIYGVGVENSYFETAFSTAAEVWEPTKEMGTMLWAHGRSATDAIARALKDTAGWGYCNNVKEGFKEAKHNPNPTPLTLEALTTCIANRQLFTHIKPQHLTQHKSALRTADSLFAAAWAVSPVNLLLYTMIVGPHFSSPRMPLFFHDCSQHCRCLQLKKGTSVFDVPSPLSHRAVLFSILIQAGFRTVVASFRSNQLAREVSSFELLSKSKHQGKFESGRKGGKAKERKAHFDHLQAKFDAERAAYVEGLEAAAKFGFLVIDLSFAEVTSGLCGAVTKVLMAMEARSELTGLAGAPHDERLCNKMVAHDADGSGHMRTSQRDQPLDVRVGNKETADSIRAQLSGTSNGWMLDLHALESPLSSAAPLDRTSTRQ